MGLNLSIRSVSGEQIVEGKENNTVREKEEQWNVLRFTCKQTGAERLETCCQLYQNSSAQKLHNHSGLTTCLAAQRIQYSKPYLYRS